MARKTQKRKKSRSPAQPPAGPPRQRGMSRRDALRTGALFGVGALLIAGGGTAFALDFRRRLVEQDLSVIGNGVPTIVQIHDPSCVQCAALQTATKRALRSFEASAVNYRVANITTEAGGQFQGEQGLPRVTLALFNGSGERVHVVSGVENATDLEDVFAYHLALPSQATKP